MAIAVEAVALVVVAVLLLVQTNAKMLVVLDVKVTLVKVNALMSVMVLQVIILVSVVIHAQRVLALLMAVQGVALLDVQVVQDIETPVQE